MDAFECIHTRMSVRKFNSEPVPKELLTKVMEAALRSPSYKNSQPWEVAVVTGNKKDLLAELLVNLVQEGVKAAPDLPHPELWPPEQEARINDHSVKRCEKIGLDLNDPAQRREAKLDNFRFFGAPAVIFLYQDASLSEWSIFDMGIFSQTLMLAAHAMGLGTVPQALLTNYPCQTKGLLGIPQSKRLILGISIGYPDLSHKVNSYLSSRVDVNSVATFL
jgi:nitroreductase